MSKINLKGITKENVIGVLVLLLALVNAVLQMFGVKTIPITNDDVNIVVTSLFLIVTALYNTYKNRNISTAAQIAQEVTNAIKEGENVSEKIYEIADKVKGK